MNPTNQHLPLILILLGPPGSGKGTQAQRLAQVYNLPHISTGDIFREHIKNSTTIGKKVQDLIQAGQLVSDDIVLEMVKERINRSDCEKGFVLDGFPRTIAQAEEFTKFFADHTTIHVLCLEVADDLIVERASGRVVCKDCGMIHHQEKGADILEICTNCYGEVYRRPDDHPEVVTERLKVYHALTEPLVQYFDEKKLLTSFDGEQSRDEVENELRQYIDQSLVKHA